MRKPNYAALYTLRKDGRYMYRWTDQEGRHAIYDRDPEKLHQKVLRLSEGEILTFKAASDGWEREYRERVTERTWHNFAPHVKDLADYWGALPVSEISAEMILADLQKLKAKGYSHTVVNSRRVIINGILNYALAKGAIPFNPCLSVRLPRGLKKGRRSAPDETVTDKILRSRDLPFGFFAFLLLCTGLRKSEALALLKSDVDLKSGVIHVTKTLTYINGSTPSVKPPKNGKSRDVPIISVLSDPLRDYMASLSGDELFPATPSTRNPRAAGYMHAHQYDGMWSRYCEAAGFIQDGKPSITAHQLRHGTATLLFEADVDPYTAQRILGHANINITLDIYTDLREKKAVRSVRKFDKAVQKLVSKPAK